jgi:ribonuclease PH
VVAACGVAWSREGVPLVDPDQAETEAAAATVVVAALPVVQVLSFVHTAGKMMPEEQTKACMAGLDGTKYIHSALRGQMANG